ncbi:hypothetical protein [Mycolicibacterium litorale]|uniref:hypothetical protein n=1 Tax=Mycolicibacterium litorale TaxID=758802 RepID=UPI001064BC91|nr:hypothetical protein [Mycolicibacterium litorale]MCV7414793.1 hypothetical protein [Mycolicibacterium litorale]TDY08038.1 hypothetical protein BCL50_0099 [Mycolicibacterium litorale]
MRASTVIPAALAATVLAACTGPAVVTTDDAGPAASATPTAPPPPPLNNTNLVNAFYFGAPVDGFTQYFFTTPSGRWECAIVPRVQAGCQAADGAALGIEGAPDTVADAAGEDTEPTAIVVGRDGEPAFVALPDAPFTPDAATAGVLQFNQVLAVAGFRCNVQEATGVSCLSERSGRGFTFSAEGFTPQYTEVPAGAFVAPPTSTTG